MITSETSTSKATSYEPVIGLEVHAQLLTASKMYCGCGADYADEPPNTRVCPVCLGLPGSLPVINQAAVELTIKTGLALNCSIAEATRFDRKNYFYPDLMKDYQISQYDLPLCRHGWVEIEQGDLSWRVGIRRVHLEEDTARLVHRIGPNGRPYALVDVNRSGVPLMEIVSEPEIRSADQARLYLMKLRAILQYLGACTGSMEEGSFRCDANVSVRPVGSTELGTKVEVKNMNSFRAVYRALLYEVERQRQVLESGGQIVQETRGWDDTRGVTVGQRTKEFAEDYRYFPEPDLPPLYPARAWVEEIRARLPELPDAKEERFVAHYGLSRYDAQNLVGSSATADYFEAVARQYPNAKVVANWVTGELFRLLNATQTDLGSVRISPAGLAEMLHLLDQGVVSQRLAKQVFEEMFRTGKSAREVVAEQGLTQISDLAELEAKVQEAMVAHPQSVADYRAGKKQALGFLVGQVMKSTRGKANPAVVNRLLVEKLGK
ncbi:MAG: Asp-tRNA(Asn)/Glu-tRNA(Gln) amidotransferase subunit GatB [Chloroflexi bacterium]|nr:Asp-tRNA(Asn)/Glu-tRNA(Gln) amidotransferase subunit GatB [Chloroflexota bacterium]